MMAVWVKNQQTLTNNDGLRLLQVVVGLLLFHVLIFYGIHKYLAIFLGEFRYEAVRFPGKELGFDGSEQCFCQGLTVQSSGTGLLLLS